MLFSDATTSEEEDEEQTPEETSPEVSPWWNCINSTMTIDSTQFEQNWAQVILYESLNDRIKEFSDIVEAKHLNTLEV